MRFVRLLRDKALSLARFPEAFPVMARYREAGIRRYAFDNYLILYRVRADQVVVLLIVHAAQDTTVCSGNDGPLPACHSPAPSVQVTPAPPYQRASSSAIPTDGS